MTESRPSRSAGDSPAVLGATRPQFGEVEIRNRARLPHWETECGTYFVTFRLHDAAPASLRDQVAERNKRPIKLPNDPRPSVKELEQYLDRCHGSCHLQKSEIAKIVAQTITKFDGVHYRLLAWVVMPNHVHLVFKMLPGKELAKAIHSLKSYTAKEANRTLRRTGAFWQREYYDRLVRDEAELLRAIDYVRENPEKAGLVNWPWMG